MNAYYSSKQAEHAASKIPPLHPQWWQLADGSVELVTSVDDSPPRFDDVVDLGPADRWLCAGNVPRDSAERMALRPSSPSSFER